MLLCVVAFAAAACAHTTFTTLFVNGVNQGDGTCVRQPKTPQTATFPVTDLASADMVCGRDGLAPVEFTCAVPAEATLTFEFREYPDGAAPGALDPSHRGPCAVYVKQVARMAAATTAPAASWFKIWEEGYDAAAGQWCTEKLIAAQGLLSVVLPAGLPNGAYLVRPELLALHEAAVGNPQFYVGCAQVLVTDSRSPRSAALDVPPLYAATIPGYVAAGDPSVTFDIYAPVFPYPLAGPPVFAPAASQSSTAAAKKPAINAIDAAVHAAGVLLVPETCLITNANWCGVEVPAYTTEAGCWDASADCFDQEAACYAAAPPSGHANCAVWDAKCMGIQAACAAGRFTGPPDAGQRLQQIEAPVPGPIPAAVGGSKDSKRHVVGRAKRLRTSS